MADSSTSRGKSHNQIVAQTERIRKTINVAISKARSEGNAERVAVLQGRLARVERASNRYLANIRRQGIEEAEKAYTKARAEFINHMSDRRALKAYTSAERKYRMAMNRRMESYR